MRFPRHRLAPSRHRLYAHDSRFAHARSGAIVGEPIRRRCVPVAAFWTRTETAGGAERVIAAVADGFEPLYESVACGPPLRRAYRPQRRRGRVAEGGGLLNRYRVVKPYRGFESLRLRNKPPPH